MSLFSQDTLGTVIKLFKADYSRSRLYTYIYNVWYYHWTSNAQFVYSRAVAASSSISDVSKLKNV